LIRGLGGAKAIKSQRCRGQIQTNPRPENKGGLNWGDSMEKTLGKKVYGSGRIGGSRGEGGF